MAKQTVTGLKELTRTLESLGKTIRDRDMNYATRKGATEIAAEARRRAPVDSGRLRDNIVVRKDRDTIFDSEYYVAIRASGKKDSPNNAFYGWFIEYGTENMPAHPFIRPAFEHGREPAIATFKDRITQRVHQRRKQIAKGKRPG